MNNLTIVFNDALEIGYDENYLNNFFGTNGFLPLNTYKRWSLLGYQVKKGEHAKKMTRLWRLKSNVRRQEAQEVEQNENATDEQMQAYFYKVNAFLFDISQVEKVTA